MRRTGAKIIALVMLSVTLSSLIASVAFADNRQPKNDAETTAKWRCYNEPGTEGGARGAIWFTNSASYYDDKVNVSSSADSVTVKIRGSVYGCLYGSPGKIYATKIMPTNPNGSRLSNLSGTTLYRGSLPNPAEQNWTSKGGEISATLDISWIPHNTGTTPQSTTFQVGIYRCFFQNGKQGSCYSDNVDVTVVRAPAPKNYSLTPTISIDPDTASEVGTPVSIYPEVDNAGPTKSDTVQWEVYRFIYTPGSTPPAGGGHSASKACTQFTAPAPSSCSSLVGGSRVFQVGTTAPNASLLSQNIPSLDPGARVCYMLSIKPWKNKPGVSGGSDWRHSGMTCVVVAKKPKLHIEDGDLRVRGGIITSISTRGGSTYGSWVDYGVFSGGANGSASYGNATASGAGLRGGLASSKPGSAWSKLTFANTLAPPTNTLGQFTLGTFSSSHDYFMNQKNTMTSGPSLTLSGTGVKVINAGANVTINMSTIPVGGTFIVKATGTVTIAGNVTYDATTPITALKYIPQVIIVADNINIRQSVTRVDAWLLATSAINTCSDRPAGNLTSNICSNSLDINGPISASKLYAYRTAGATKTSPGSPAETIRLTPTTYLWAFNYTNQADRVRTTYVTEEPPRF